MDLGKRHKTGMIIEQPIGRYMLIKKVGRGGMGSVYKAYDLKLERTVALKLLSSSIGENEEEIKRFEREAISNAKLRHSNIVTLYDFEQENGLYFLTMDFVDGPSLCEFLSQNRLSFEKSCRFMLQILDGIQYAHGKGIIHRDIKPGNILVDQEEKLFITDFGLAKIPDQSSKISQDGSILGTPAYMSPEQASMGANSVDFRCDIYALGVLFYEMLTGQVPFEGEPLLVLTKLISEDPRKPREINPDIPDELERICLKAMDKKKEKRYSSAEEFMQEIQAYLARKEKVPNPSNVPLSADSTETNQEKPHRDAVFFANISSKMVQKDSIISSKLMQSKQDNILQQQLLALNMIDPAKVSECLFLQADIKSETRNRSLLDIVVEKGYIDRDYACNLLQMKDRQGKSMIPEYEIMSFIAEGERSLVYLGKNLKTSQTVVIKLYAPTISNMSDTIARFMRESAASRNLDHPNIIKSKDYGSINNVYYLIMDYVPGSSLSEIISKTGRFEERKALEILEQLAEALTCAWENNVIHRDIKPSNILSDKDVVKISNLGFAKALQSGLDVTQEGNTVGTPQFMSPEQFEETKGIDFRSDVYSLGITFYLMLTGSLPFSSETKMGLAQAHMKTPPPPVEKFHVHISKPTKVLLYKMLEKKRERRCKEKRELLEDIKKVKQGKLPKCIGSRGSFNKMMLAAAVLLLVSLVAGAGYWSMKYAGKERAKKEILRLIQGRKYEEALKKIEECAPVPAEEKKTLFVMLEERKKKDPEILDVLPANGHETSDTEVKLVGHFKGENWDHLLINDQKADVIAQEGERWRFEHLVALSLGQNSIDIVLVSKEGDKQKMSSVFLRKEREVFNPEIVILEPKGVEKNGQKNFQNDSIVLRGYAIHDKIQAILVNDKQIPVLVSEGKAIFEFPLKLKPGVQNVTITAMDPSGNSAIYGFKALLESRGWFGEEMPFGMTKYKYYGEYLWEKDKSIMVFVPKGEFVYKRSSKDPEKKHLESFYIDKYETTWRQYRQFCRETASPYPDRKVQESHPVVELSLQEIKKFMEWVGKTMPSMAHWIKASRGGIEVPSWNDQLSPMIENPLPQRLYPWGEDFESVSSQSIHRCNYIGLKKKDGDSNTTPVGIFSYPSPYRCYDMMGNVWELCATQDGSAVKTGGGFKSGRSQCRIGFYSVWDEKGEEDIGFRLVKRMD